MRQSAREPSSPRRPKRHVLQPLLHVSICICILPLVHRASLYLNTRRLAPNGREYIHHPSISRHAYLTGADKKPSKIPKTIKTQNAGSANVKRCNDHHLIHLMHLCSFMLSCSSSAALTPSTKTKPPISGSTAGKRESTLSAQGAGKSPS